MSLIITEKLESVLHIKLNRPQVHNAFNMELITSLTEIFKSVGKDPHIRAVVLTGEGKSFCAGGDLTWMKSMVEYSEEDNLKDAEVLYDMFAAGFHCPVPVIGKVHGNVRGGGLGITAICDIVAAETDTKFGFSEAHLGLVPSVICPFVARKMRETYLREFMITGKIFSAQRAYECGLVHFVGNEGSIKQFIQETLDAIRKCGPESIKLTKELIDFIHERSTAESRTETIKVIAGRRVSKEGQEGMRAFLEKRSPSWRITR